LSEPDFLREIWAIFHDIQSPFCLLPLHAEYLAQNTDPMELPVPKKTNKTK